METSSNNEFLILIKCNISIDSLVKSLAKKFPKAILHKIKWMHISEHKVNELSYLAISLNELTFNIIKKLKKQEWIFSHNYILRDKFHDENHKVINSELGFYKYKLLNTVMHGFFLDEITAVDNNLWQVLDAEKQSQLLNFFSDLRKKRKVDFLILNEIFLNNIEEKIANKICEQANAYRKHYSLLRMGQEIIKGLGSVENIIDFYIENSVMIFIVKNYDLINEEILKALEIVKKITLIENLGVVKIKTGHDMEGCYQILKKIISNNPNNFVSE